MKIKNILLLLFVMSFTLKANTQDIKPDSSKSKLNVSTDLVSRYVWRGLAYGTGPAIQPSLSYTYKGFEAGVWGSYNIIGTYHETDPYLKYSIGCFSLTATDYFTHYEIYPNKTKYFNYNSPSTNHIFEGAIQYHGKESFPLTVLAGTYFYGNDKHYGYDLSKDTTNKNYYSTYIELGYAFNCKGNKFDAFIGGTPMPGAYGSTYGIVNVGITAYRSIQITDKFELPIKASLIANPQAENFYFVLVITL